MAAPAAADDTHFGGDQLARLLATTAQSPTIPAAELRQQTLRPPTWEPARAIIARRNRPY